jgi:cob(I)alamin adenosyltransferase
MKVYTKTGDNGTTSLYDGTRCNKFSNIFMALGELDELNSRVGLLIAEMEIGEGTMNTDPSFMTRIETNLRQIQCNIQNINSVLASGKKITKNMIGEDITNLENEIDWLESYNPRLTKFILPGVTKADAISHVCRTQARKAERFMWLLQNETIDVPPLELAYMNRLSDYFFVLARWICAIQNIKDATM